MDKLQKIEQGALDLLHSIDVFVTESDSGEHLGEYTCYEFVGKYSTRAVERSLYQNYKNNVEPRVEELLAKWKELGESVTYIHRGIEIPENATYIELKPTNDLNRAYLHLRTLQGGMALVENVVRKTNARFKCITRVFERKASLNIFKYLDVYARLSKAIVVANRLNKEFEETRDAIFKEIEKK